MALSRRSAGTSSGSRKARSRSLDGKRLVGFHRAGTRLLAEHRPQVELEHGDPFVDTERGEDLGGDLAHRTDRVAAGDERGRPRRVQSRRHTRLVDARADTHRRGNLPPHRDRRRRLPAGEHDTQRLVLLRQLARAGLVHVPDLEERHAWPAMRLVERDGAEQPRPQRRSQDALLGDERVADPHRGPVETHAGEIARSEERIRHHLGDSEPEQHVTHPPAPLLEES